MSTVNAIENGKNYIKLEQIDITGHAPLKGKEKNYYREVEIFGDIATKKDQYPDQKFVPSKLNEITKSTSFVEDVVANIKAKFDDLKNRDAKMADIFAKQIGTWTRDGKQVSGGFALEKTEAYKFALAQNKEDYTVRETEFRGQKETHAFLDMSKGKSDGKINLFSAEIIDGKEYFAMRDKDGKVHYFDKADNLKEVEIK